MDAIQAYCEFDMTNVRIHNPQLIKGRNRSVITGTCTKCGNIAYKIIGGVFNEHESPEHTGQGLQEGHDK